MADDTVVQKKAIPLYIRINEHDNVAIVVNDGGLKAGAQFACALQLVEGVPQGHKVALTAIPKGQPVVRYNVVIGHALEDLPEGSWVNEQKIEMPDAPTLENLPIATQVEPVREPLTGYTFEGFRNDDGTVGTRNVLALSTSVQCVSGVVAFAVDRIKKELLPRYPNVDDVIAIDHAYGCGVAIMRQVLKFLSAHCAILPLILILVASPWWLAWVAKNFSLRVYCPRAPFPF